jgi:hypothetical protein
MTVASSAAQRREGWHPRPVVDDGEASHHGLTRPSSVPARHPSGLRVRVEHLPIQPQQLTNVLVAGLGAGIGVACAYQRYPGRTGCRAPGGLAVGLGAALRRRWRKGS